MKTRIIPFLLILFLAPAVVYAGGSEPKCATKYPIVMSHGMAASAEILGIIDYWGNIPGALEDEGAEVYITSVNGMDSTRNKAEAFKLQLDEILAVSGAEKVNVIGHSHGTLYTRDAISNLGMGDSVASHTSIAGPHQGSYIASLIMNTVREGIADLLMIEAGVVEEVVASFLDFIYAFVFGDTNPNSAENGWDLVPEYMQTVFNPNTKNVEGIYYQSWAAEVKTFCPSVLMQPFWMLMLPQEGPNDGLVSVESAKWGEFKGSVSGAWWSPGVDHMTVFGFPLALSPGFSASDFYVDIVADLKAEGF